MELEEAIKICEDFIEENKDRKIILHTAIQTIIDNSIPKKKIEDKIKWLDEMLNNPDKEVIYANYRYTRNILEELLGDKIDEDIKYRPGF